MNSLNFIENKYENCRAYTYLVGWTKHNKWYYGVRYAKGCTPLELWKTYFTSSKHVHNFREQYGEPDLVEIRKTFNSKDNAIDWEFNVLKKLKVKSNDKWLNVAIGKPSFLGKTHSEETRIKMRKPKPKGFGEIVKNVHLGKKRSEETKIKISNSKKGLSLRSKKWIFLLNDKVVEIVNLKNFCRKNNLNVSCMSDVYYGKQKQHKNYRKVL